MTPIGCGRLIHVIGTNGGTLACGALLTALGKTAPYLCEACRLIAAAPAMLAFIRQWGRATTNPHHTCNECMECEARDILHTIEGEQP